MSPPAPNRPATHAESAESNPTTISCSTLTESAPAASCSAAPGADLEPAVRRRARLEDRLRVARWPAHDRAVRQPEARAVPRTGDDAVLDLAAGERTAGVTADAVHRRDDAVDARDEDRPILDRDRARLPVGQLVLADRARPPARAFVPRGVIHHHPAA